MPLARLDAVGAFVYGGTLVPGVCDPPLRPSAPSQFHRGGQQLTIVQLSRSYCQVWMPAVWWRLVELLPQDFWIWKNSIE